MTWAREIEDIVKKNKGRLDTWLGFIEEGQKRAGMARRKFHQWGGLRAYLSVSRITSAEKQNANSVECIKFSLRFLGQEVAELIVRGDRVFLKLRKEHIENNSSYFLGFNGLGLSVDEYPWKEGKAKAFRSFFEQPMGFKKGGVKSPEHRIESKILQEMFKESKKQKFQGTFWGIQPVTVSGFPLQIPLPVWASEGVPQEASRKGSVDILARRNNKRLSVWELKAPGKYVNQKTLRQAYLYALTILKILRSANGDRWYRVFGYSASSVPPKIRIEAVVVITEDKQQCLLNEFRKWKSKMPLVFGTDAIELCVAYYKDDEKGLRIVSYQPIADNE